MGKANVGVLEDFEFFGIRSRSHYFLAELLHSPFSQSLQNKQSSFRVADLKSCDIVQRIIPLLLRF